MNQKTTTRARHERSGDALQAQQGAAYAGALELRQAEALANYNRHICGLFRREYRDGTVLDFGAGIGTLTDLLSDVGEILCVEPDPSQAETLRAKGYRVLAGVDSLADESVSFVYSSNVLEHVDDDLGALRDIHRKMCPGGRLALFVPAFESIWTSNDDRVGHRRRYTRESLAAVVERSGFRVEHVRYVDSIGFLLAFLFRFIGSRDGSLNTAHLVMFDRLVFPISRALDVICRRFFGKNVYLVACKQAT